MMEYWCHLDVHVVLSNASHYALNNATMLFGNPTVRTIGLHVNVGVRQILKACALGPCPDLNKK